ncbi:hypothetical protein LNP05_06740 [Klebsiella pneumoniae subsp. pneumoniae]|nr:hypothetical protein [Klebsiella pneumoniae subsp. pneumoniae]
MPPTRKEVDHALEVIAAGGRSRNARSGWLVSLNGKMIGWTDYRPCSQSGGALGFRYS